MYCVRETKAAWQTRAPGRSVGSDGGARARGRPWGRVGETGGVVRRNAHPDVIGTLGFVTSGRQEATVGVKIAREDGLAAMPIELGRDELHWMKSGAVKQKLMQ